MLVNQQFSEYINLLIKKIYGAFALSSDSAQKGYYIEIFVLSKTRLTNSIMSNFSIKCSQARITRTDKHLDIPKLPDF